MTDSDRIAAIRAEFIKTYGPEPGRGTLICHDNDMWNAAYDGFLLAHTSSEMSKDARRLEWIERWLFNKHWNGVIDSGSRTHWSVATNYRHLTVKMEGKTFRAAIDNATAAIKEQTK